MSNQCAPAAAAAFATPPMMAFNRMNDDVVAVVFDFLPFELVGGALRRTSKAVAALVASCAVDGPLVRLFTHLRQEARASPVVDCGRFVDGNFGSGVGAAERIGLFAAGIRAQEPPDAYGLLRGFFAHPGPPRWHAATLSLPPAIASLVAPWFKAATRRRGKRVWQPRPGDPVIIPLGPKALAGALPAPRADPMSPLHVLRAILESPASLLLRPAVPGDLRSDGADPTPAVAATVQALLDGFSGGAMPIKHGSDAAVVCIAAGDCLVTQRPLPTVPGHVAKVITATPAVAFEVASARSARHVRVVYVKREKLDQPSGRHRSAPAPSVGGQAGFHGVTIDLSDWREADFRAVPGALEGVDLPIRAAHLLGNGTLGLCSKHHTLDLRHLRQLRQVAGLVTDARRILVPRGLPIEFGNQFAYRCCNLVDFDFTGLNTDAANVGHNVLAECKALRRVVLPKSWSTIPVGFCRDCPALVSVDVAALSALTSIGHFALSGDMGLRGVTLPANVTRVESGALRISPPATAMPSGGGCRGGNEHGAAAAAHDIVLDASACARLQRFEGAAQPFANTTLFLHREVYARMEDVVAMPSYDTRCDASGLTVACRATGESRTLPIIAYDACENDYPDRYQHNDYC